MTSDCPSSSPFHLVFTCFFLGLAELFGAFKSACDVQPGVESIPLESLAGREDFFAAESPCALPLLSIATLVTCLFHLNPCLALMFASLAIHFAAGCVCRAGCIRKQCRWRSFSHRVAALLNQLYNKICLWGRTFCGFVLCHTKSICSRARRSKTAEMTTLSLCYVAYICWSRRVLGSTKLNCLRRVHCISKLHREI